LGDAGCSVVEDGDEQPKARAASATRRLRAELPMGDDGSSGERKRDHAALFNESFTDYENENLTDGTQPQAIELLMRSIEWAGGWY
jgi:hypothetical protein